MPNLSLGTIEVLGLPAAVEAADVACKTADVKLIGYETTDGMGMVAVKIEGQVSAVKAAVAAAGAAAARVSKVFATSVIARPSDQLPPIVFTKETVGLAKPKVAEAPKTAPEPEPVVEPEPETVVGPDLAMVAAAQPAPEPVAEAAASVEEKPVVELPAPPKPPTVRRTTAAKSRPIKK